MVKTQIIIHCWWILHRLVITGNPKAKTSDVKKITIRIFNRKGLMYDSEQAPYTVLIQCMITSTKLLCHDYHAKLWSSKSKNKLELLTCLIAMGQFSHRTSIIAYWTSLSLLVGLFHQMCGFCLHSPIGNFDMHNIKPCKYYYYSLVLRKCFTMVIRMSTLVKIVFYYIKLPTVSCLKACPTITWYSLNRTPTIRNHLWADLY